MQKEKESRLLIGGLVLFVLVLIYAAVAGTNTGPTPTEARTSNDDQICSDLRSVSRTAIEGISANPVVEKDMCSNDGARAIYEAFVKTRGQSGRAAHFKFTFNGLNARSGLQELCQDARTGIWECGP